MLFFKIVFRFLLINHPNNILDLHIRSFTAVFAIYNSMAQRLDICLKGVSDKLLCTVNCCVCEKNTIETIFTSNSHSIAFFGNGS